MKALKILMIVLFLAPFSSRAQDINLDKLPQKQRDSLLLVISERAIKFFGPDFYRETTPKIERTTGGNGADYFIVTYPSRDDEKHMIGNEAAKIKIDVKTGQVFASFGGSNGGTSVEEYDFINNPPAGVYEWYREYPTKPLSERMEGVIIIKGGPWPDEAELREKERKEIQEDKERLERGYKEFEERTSLMNKLDEQLKEKYPNDKMRIRIIIQGIDSLWPMEPNRQPEEVERNKKRAENWLEELKRQNEQK